MRAHDVMSSPVVTATRDTPTKEAADLLATHGFTALPVIDEDRRLIGIVTEADLVRNRFPRDARRPIEERERPRTEPSTMVGELMTEPAVCMSEGTDVVDLVRVMLDLRLRSIPIVDGAYLVGIVSRHDLVRVLARDDSILARDIRNRLEIFGGPGRWQVTVHDGSATITDTFDNKTDRHVAEVLAESVPGVTRAHVRHR